MPGQKTIADLETPCVLIDVDRARANVLRAQAYADKHSKQLWPHIKTHKLPYWAKLQMEAGATGITCQKIGEAEVMADAGLPRIFLPYNIIGDAKLKRLAALHQRVGLSVTADSSVTVTGLAGTFTDPNRRLDVLVECETGMKRCGVLTAEQALDLARQISTAPGLRFAGLMTYPAAGAAEFANVWLGETSAFLSKNGLPCERISSGGTPDIWRLGDTAVTTEYRPGTYIYLDRYQVAKGAGSAEDCALTVLATVVSRPTADRAVIDAGSKALTSDTLGMQGFGDVIGMPGVIVARMSEEHGVVELTDGAELRIGDRIRILPNHACVVSNLYDEVHLISGDRLVETVAVAARGRLT